MLSATGAPTVPAGIGGVRVTPPAAPAPRAFPRQLAGPRRLLQWRDVKAILIGLCFAPLIFAADTVEGLGYRWTVQQASDWSIANEELRLLVPGVPPAGQPRRPQKFALAQTEPFQRANLEVEMLPVSGALIIVFAWQDNAHYDYVHLSTDTGREQPNHNGVFHVFGGERVRISSLEGPVTFKTREWTPIKLVFDGVTGHCYAEVNGQLNPSLEAYDLSLRSGLIGLGSFDNTGSFRKIHLTGEAAANTPPTRP